MIIRRMAEAIREQNWFTVIIEILIVVIGIFLGLQVTEWNEVRKDHVNYEQALERLKDEVTDSLEIIDVESTIINEDIAIVRAGMEALIACSGTPQTVNHAIARVRGTRSVEFHAPTLFELTSNSTLQAAQSSVVRKRLADLRYFLELTRGISEQFEPDPFTGLPMNTPTLKIAAPEKMSGIYFGIEYEVPRYPVVLAVPITDACKDKNLQKLMLRWEAWHTNVLIFNKKIRQEYVDTLALLQEVAQ